MPKHMLNNEPLCSFSCLWAKIMDYKDLMERMPKVDSMSALTHSIA